MAPIKWQLDPAHTNLEFAVRHLMIATVRGRFGSVQGSIDANEADPRSATVDVTSMWHRLTRGRSSATRIYAPLTSFRSTDSRLCAL